MSHNSEYCKNCNQHLYLHQNFCHNCGQKTDTHRINSHFLLHEIQHSFLHIDGGIIFTLKELFTRPGKMLREYLDGRRQPHFKPVLTVLILGSIYAIVSHFTTSEEHTATDSVEEKLLQKDLDKFGEGSQLYKYFESVAAWVSEHFAMMILILLPMTAFAFYLAFKKYKVFYAEWLVVLCYLSAQTLLVYTVFTVVDLLPFDLSFLFVFTVFGLFIWTIIQFFSQENKFQVVLRTFFAGFLATVFNFFYVTVIAVLLLVFGFTKYGKKEKLDVFFNKENSDSLKIHLEEK